MTYFFNISGPPDVGKTVAAFTASPTFPKDPVGFAAKGKPLIIEDVLHVMWDQTAAAPLSAFGIKCRHAIDGIAALRKVKGNIRRAMLDVNKQRAAIYAGKHGITVEVHDTISQFDAYSVNYWWQLCTPEGAIEPADKRKVWGYHLYTHGAYSQDVVMRPEGVHIVCLFHDKVIEEGAQDTAGQKMRNKLGKLGLDDVKVRPDVKGGGLDMYSRYADYEFGMSRTKTNEKHVFKRWLHPVVDAVDGHRAKSKGLHLFKEKMPADLGAVIKTLEKAAKGGK